MAIGPGKYDNLCTVVREETQAIGVIVIVVGGKQGGGFSVQMPPTLLPVIPGLLDDLAKSIREDLQGENVSPR